VVALADPLAQAVADIENKLRRGEVRGIGAVLLAVCMPTQQPGVFAARGIWAESEHAAGLMSAQVMRSGGQVATVWRAPAPGKVAVL
jgi:hypothetical protein